MNYLLYSENQHSWCFHTISVKCLMLICFSFLTQYAQKKEAVAISSKALQHCMKNEPALCIQNHREQQ